MNRGTRKGKKESASLGFPGDSEEEKGTGPLGEKEGHF